LSYDTIFCGRKIISFSEEPVAFIFWEEGGTGFIQNATLPLVYTSVNIHTITIACVIFLHSPVSFTLKKVTAMHIDMEGFKYSFARH
jgi:hypothetical protein